MPKEENEMTFKEWLAMKRITDTPRGDFISDVLCDENFPDFNFRDANEQYLLKQRACQEAIKEFRKLWREYERSC